MSSLLPDPPRSGHFVRFYDEDRFLLDEVAAFVEEALDDGGAGIVIATPEHLAALAGGIACHAQAVAEGRLVALDAAATLARFMVEGWPDARRFRRVVGSRVARAAAGGRRVHAFGEMVALLCADGKPEAALRLEELWNELGERLTFSLFCAYPSGLFTSAEHTATFQRVCGAHAHVCASEQVVHARTPDDLHRLLALWQHKAGALEAEVARREGVERALRQRERELADFVENAAEGLHKVGADGTILWANQAELDLLGYARDEYVGRHVADFHVDRTHAERILARLAAGETLYDEPALLRCKDGAARHVVIHSNGYFEGGELQYTRCFTRDATDRVERERLLAELADANRAKDEFLALLGHELRNPLSPIVTALQLMRMRGDTGTAREQGIIERQLDHLVRLVDDLLDVSRVTRGKIQLKVERCQLSDVLTKAVEMASLLLEQRSHRLTVDLVPGLQWEGDPVRLAQVVANLLTNAARYTGVGGDVRLSARPGPDGDVVIAVRDNGIGISPDMLGRIFEPFVQGRRSVDRAEGGLGIGLALVKSLVELHGGTVTAHSDGPGRGSEFTIRLPAAAPAATAGDIVADTLPAPARAPLARRVLVVDDNVDGAETLGQLLQASGHHVKVLHDPVAALRAVDGFAPDVAVLDIGLPVMDGYELASRLRERIGAAAACRFIALSGYGQEADRSRSERAGFALHFVKPVDPTLVIDAIARP